MSVEPYSFEKPGAWASCWHSCSFHSPFLFLVALSPPGGKGEFRKILDLRRESPQLKLSWRCTLSFVLVLKWGIQHPLGRVFKVQSIRRWSWALGAVVLPFSSSRLITSPENTHCASFSALGDLCASTNLVSGCLPPLSIPFVTSGAHFQSLASAGGSLPLNRTAEISPTNIPLWESSCWLSGHCHFYHLQQAG